MYLGYILGYIQDVFSSLNTPRALIQPQWKLPALLTGCIEQGGAEIPAQHWDHA